jgi:CRP/FNR family cyclic AMP-dependent transcriptional regulator
MSTPKPRLREVLAESELFETLAEGELDQVVAIASRKQVGAGETVFLRGQPARALYAVVSGQVKVVATASDGREIVLRLIDPGACFGEIALLDGGARTATLVASVPSELIVIDRRDLLDLLRRRPEIALELLAVVAQRLRSTTEQVEDTNFLQLTQRLARKLLELASTYGSDEGAGTRIRISQEELGNLVATSRVSINQQLKAWEKEGLLQTSRGAVTILDREGLAAAAER